MTEPERIRTGGARARTSAEADLENFTVQVSGDVRAFADVWPTLATLEDVPNARSFPFQCRDHLEIWQETIGVASRIQPLFIRVSGRDATQLMMIPLGIRRRRGISVLTFLDEGVADYNAPLLFRAAADLDAEDVRKIWTLVCRAAPFFDVAVLEKMPAMVADFRNPLALLAREPWPMLGHFLALDGEACALPLQSGHEAKENRRYRRRLAQLGPVSFQVATSETDIKNVFDVFVRQKIDRYRETLGMDDFEVPGQRAYYLAAARRLLGRGAYLAWLAAGEEIVATAWCLSAGRRFYYMMCAFEGNEPWRKCSPGRLLLEELVNWARDNGYEVFDFGIGDEEYKFRWRQAPVPLCCALYPRTLKGRLYCGLVALRKAAKRHLPKSPIRAMNNVRAPIVTARRLPFR